MKRSIEDIIEKKIHDLIESYLPREGVSDIAFGRPYEDKDGIHFMLETSVYYGEVNEGTYKIDADGLYGYFCFALTEDEYDDGYDSSCMTIINGEFVVNIEDILDNLIDDSNIKYKR